MMFEASSPWLFAVQLWPKLYLSDLLRYLFSALLFTLLVTYLPKAWRARRAVRARTPSAGQRKREFWNSMGAVLIFSVNAMVIAAGMKAGILLKYSDWNQYGWLYAIFSLIVLLVLHDTWFYWTHRLLHHRKVFRWAHATHHRSIAPTPWATYSFAIAESVTQVAFFTLILLVLPLHPIITLIFLIHMVVRNTQSHTGVELVPRAWLAGWWGRWMTTTLHHDLHHATGRYNYGFYFAWWDRICGTEHPEYRRLLKELIDRIDAPSVVNQPAQTPTRGAEPSMLGAEEGTARSASIGMGGR